MDPLIEDMYKLLKGVDIPASYLQSVTSWWQLKYFLFPPRTLQMISNLTSIVFRRVGSTTN